MQPRYWVYLVLGILVLIGYVPAGMMFFAGCAFYEFVIIPLAKGNKLPPPPPNNQLR